MILYELLLQQLDNYIIVLEEFIINLIFIILYFNVVKWSYFQGMVIVPYLSFSTNNCNWSNNIRLCSTNYKSFWPSRGFFQYLVKSWSTIVEFISVWKRLREFEEKLKLIIQNPLLDKST